MIFFSKSMHVALLTSALLGAVGPARSSEAAEFDFFALDPFSACHDLFGEPRSVEDRLFEAYEKSLDGYRAAVSSEDFHRSLERAIRSGNPYDFHEGGGPFSGFIAKIAEAREAIGRDEFDARVRRHLETFSADAKRIAHEVEVSVTQTAETRSIERTLKGHSGLVETVQTNATGTRAISASADGTLILWDLESGKIDRTLAGHSGTVHLIRVNSDFTRALSGSLDGRVILWDIEAGTALKTLTDASGIQQLEVSGDFKTVVTKSVDEYVRVWDLPSETKLREFKVGDPKKVEIATSLKISPDLKRAVTECDDSIDVWDLETGKRIFATKDSGHKADGYAQFDETLTRAMTLGEPVPNSINRFLFGWDLVEGKLLWQDEVSINATSMSPIRSSHPWGGVNGYHSISIRDLNTGSIVFSLERHLPDIKFDAFALSGDSKKVLSLTSYRSQSGGTLMVTDLATKRETLRYTIGKTPPNRIFYPAPDFSRVVMHTGVPHELISYNLHLLEQMF